MILGMSTATFTLVHVLLSLAGIASGFVVLAGLLTGKRRDRSTALFLATTALTSVTGFGFPFDHLLPSHAIGILSLLVLAVAIAARYSFHLAGAWRRTYVITAAIALYLNIFVLVVQLFLKVPALKDLAPTQKEPPFSDQPDDRLQVDGPIPSCGAGGPDGFVASAAREPDPDVGSYREGRARAAPSATGLGSSQAAPTIARSGSRGPARGQHCPRHLVQT